METLVSVIIPTARNAPVLTRCLEALRAATAGLDDWEILVLDNSPDPLKPETARAASECGLPALRYIPMPPLGLMAARHLGALEARGDVLAFLDDDSFVAKTWFAGLCASFLNPATMLATGPVRPEYEHSPPGWLDSLWTPRQGGRCLGHLSLYDYGPTECALPPTAVYGCNYAVRADLFWRLQGSLPDYMPAPWQLFQGTGESGLSAKIAHAGFEAAYVPACSIAHLVSARKMTIEYLATRAYVFGIEASFDHARAAHGFGPAEGVLAPRPGLARLPARLARIAVSLFRQRARQTPAGRKPESVEAATLSARLRTGRAQGYSDHRTELRRSTALRNFVLREHYLGANALIPAHAEPNCGATTSSINAPSPAPQA